MELAKQLLDACLAYGEIAGHSAGLAAREGKQPLPCRSEFWVWLRERMPEKVWQKLMDRMTEAQRVEVGAAFC